MENGEWKMENEEVNSTIFHYPFYIFNSTTIFHYPFYIFNSTTIFHYPFSIFNSKGTTTWQW